MFNDDFYPTPPDVIDIMTEGLELSGKVILEPSAGSGAIVDFLTDHGATVIACESNASLKVIIQSKCKLIAEDFLTVTSDQISHIDLIIMNPPFSRGVDHVLHAFNIAPRGCKIVSLLNISNLQNTHTSSRKELASIIERHGSTKDLQDCFKDAERKTGVHVSMVTLTKPGESYRSEFQGFFTEEDPEESQVNGIMSYNVVRDLVNRYVAAVKLYDEQLLVGRKMNDLLSGFYGNDLAFTCTSKGAPVLRDDFKKSLQKAGWKFIFDKMDMKKYATRGLREDINKFVEQQTNVPFTMRNIYHMLDMVVQTASQRMDKALIEVFDRVTEHHHDNRHNIKGWKTNSHYLVGKKFILPYMISPAKEYGYTSDSYTSLKSAHDGTIPDLEKALCYITGADYGELDDWNYHNKEANLRSSKMKTVNRSIDRNTYGEWYESHFFKYKGYKNGNMHFEFVSEDVWANFNQRIAKIKGYPLFEAKAQTKYQERQTGRATQQKSNPAHHYKPTVLFEL